MAAKFIILGMEKNLFFIANDGTGYDFRATAVPFDDNGVTRVKFKEQDSFSTHFIQRLDGDHWVLLEGDMIDEYVQRIGTVIRKNFET